MVDKMSDKEFNSNFNLVQPFYIDNGELKNLTCQQIFVLGYEFCELFTKVKEGISFCSQFHSDNEPRVRKMLADQGINCFEIRVHDDWPVLVVFGGEEEYESR